MVMLRIVMDNGKQRDALRVCGREDAVPYAVIVGLATMRRLTTNYRQVRQSMVTNGARFATFMHSLPSGRCGETD
jgi:hypothetical protein